MSARKLFTAASVGARLVPMTEPNTPSPPLTEAERKQQRRKARLAERLRANLQRRKAQTRARRAGEADQRPDGLTADEDESGN